MKKILFCALLCALTVTTVFSQARAKGQKHPNQQVVDMLNNSLESNGALTLTDLNTIYVGQNATFPLQYGGTIVFTAEKNSTFWMLGDSALTYQEMHPENPIIIRADRIKGQDVLDTTQKAGISPVVSKKKSGGIPWQWFVLLVAAVLILFFILRDEWKRAQKKKRLRENSEEVLVPLVHGGISDSQAPAYMQQMAARRNLTIIGPTESGRLTTTKPIQMAYVGTQRMEPFQNEPFYRAKARNNADQTEGYAYFRQVCGNDATIIRDSDVIWTVDTNQSQEIREANTATSTPLPSVQQQSRTEVVLPTAVALVDLVKTAVEKIADKDNGTVECDVPGFKFKMEFSKDILIGGNHTAPAHDEKHNVKKSLS